jgi:hypothetical protein
MQIAKVCIMMKHNDTACMHLIGVENEDLFEKTDGLPCVGVFGGDTTELEIDNATGRIIGWKPITDEELLGV